MADNDNPDEDAIIITNVKYPCYLFGPNRQSRFPKAHFCNPCSLLDSFTVGKSPEHKEKKSKGQRFLCKANHYGPPGKIPSQPCQPIRNHHQMFPPPPARKLPPSQAKVFRAQRKRAREEKPITIDNNYTEDTVDGKPFASNPPCTPPHGINITPSRQPDHAPTKKGLCSPLPDTQHAKIIDYYHKLTDISPRKIMKIGDGGFICRPKDGTIIEWAIRAYKARHFRTHDTTICKLVVKELFQLASLDKDVNRLGQEPLPEHDPVSDNGKPFPFYAPLRDECRRLYKRDVLSPPQVLRLLDIEGSGFLASFTAVALLGELDKDDSCPIWNRSFMPSKSSLSRCSQKINQLGEALFPLLTPDTGEGFSMHLDVFLPNFLKMFGLWEKATNGTGTVIEFCMAGDGAQLNDNATHCTVFIKVSEAR